MIKPLAYNNMIQELASIYIKDGLVIKNRYGDSGIKVNNNLTKWLEMSDNNLVIEKKGVISIYCTKDKESIYKKQINYVRHNSSVNVDAEINIYLINEKEHNQVNDELIRILNKCNKKEIMALRINVDERYFIGEDKEGRISVFKFRDFVNGSALNKLK